MNLQTLTTQQLGDYGESYATKFLTEKGHLLIQINYQTKYTELDILTYFKGQLYAFEIKTTKSKKQTVLPVVRWHKKQYKKLQYLLTHDPYFLKFIHLPQIVFLWFALYPSDNLKLQQYFLDSELFYDSST